MTVFTNALNILGVSRGFKADGDMREFLAQSAIRALLEKTGATDEDFMRSEMLLIFDTRAQHTWLIATNAALYCVIDNRRQKHARKLWRIARSDIEKNGRLAIQINESALTERDSYLIVDGKRPRKFTKHLFATLTIKESVENMLRNAFKL